MLGNWKDIRPDSDVVSCLQFLQCEALKHVRILRAWRRSGAEMEPYDIMVNGVVWMERWIAEKTQVLGADRITRIQWRGMPKIWWSISRVAAETRDDAVRAWLPVAENAEYEIGRIENGSNICGCDVLRRCSCKRGNCYNHFFAHPTVAADAALLIHAGLSMRRRAHSAFQRAPISLTFIV